jgi:peptidoglycan-associated lipoprotein
MKLIAWKRFSLLMMLALVLVSFGCHKKAAAPPPPAPAPPPPPPPPPPAPTVSLTADRTTITAGQSATLSYTAQNATTVTINPGIGAVQPATSGTRQVSPMATTSYTATATGPGGTANSAAVNITVNQPPPPPAPPRPTPPPPPPAGPSLDELFTRTMQPIFFDFDKYSIRADQEPTLLAIAAWLKQNQNVRFTIEGHADERGSQEYNIALGDERAASTKKYLAGQGIAENRMNTVSYGEERPVCKDPTEACWQRNRRAAFVRIP